MYRNIILVMVLVLIGTFACQNKVDICQNKVDITAEEEAIKAVTQQQNDAWRNRSLESEQAVWANEPYVLRIIGSSGNRTVGWDSLSTWYKSFFEQNPTGPSNENVTFSNYHVRVYDNAAWAVYDVHWEWTNEEGETESWDSWQIRFLEKKECQWKIVLQQSRAYPSVEEE